jgi:alkylhydroperoxidase family enzyme
MTQEDPVNRIRKPGRFRSRQRGGFLALFVCTVLGLSQAPLVRAQDANGPREAHVPLLSNAAAWQRLPECETAGVELPNWARGLADSLPHTTAAILELDGVYRTSGIIDPKLRAKMRWVAADENGCTYGKAYALADLRRAGAVHEEIIALTGDRSSLPAAERAALEFARKMTKAAHTLTDEEVAGLVAEYGEPQLVEMVLQMAYANFLDRLVLSLGISVEEGGPLPPRVFSFPAFANLQEVPAANRPEDLPRVEQPVLSQQPLRMNEVFGRDWTSLQFDQLQQMMDLQRARPGRVSIPDWTTVRDKLPPGMYPRDREMKIKWSLAVLGHQPTLGSTWLRCLRVFGREADFDRVLAESMFWVVTRSLECFY